MIPEQANKTYKIYYCPDYEAYIVDNYVSENLPLNGWIKFCINCGTYTSKYIIRAYLDEPLVINVCNNCRKRKQMAVDIRISKLFDKIVQKNITINKV